MTIYNGRKLSSSSISESASSPLADDFGARNNVASDESKRTKRKRNLWGEYKQRASFAVAKNPSIVLIPWLIFLSFMFSGMSIITTTAISQDKAAKVEARILAMETGEWFASQLDLATGPLFSLAQFVRYLKELNELADKIGRPDDGKGAPLIPPVNRSGFATHRNVTGICDDPSLLKRFNEIAGTIKKNSRLGKVLVNLQIAPHGVVCMTHPINNTEDFDEGMFLDSTGVIGHDLLQDPERSFIAKATVRSDRVVVAGPLTLRQCPDCVPTVSEAFIARLPIESKSHQIVVDNVSYKRWGFVVALINWSALVGRSKIHDRFAQRGFSFQLTRTDLIEDKGSGGFKENVVVLAESPNFDRGDHEHIVSTKLATTNNDWVLAVNYTSAVAMSWKPYALLVAFGFSLCFALLAYVVLLHVQIHSDLDAQKNKLQADQAIQMAQSQRELNDYLSHEVRNPLAAALSACTFVTCALQRTLSTTPSSQLSAAAAQATRSENELMKELNDDIMIIDRSLKFMNELLRSILDSNRVNDNLIELQKTEVDIRQDIFEPVSAMIYKRDNGFALQTECPENFVIEADRLRMQQVVLNLTRDAAKFVVRGFIRLRAFERKGSCDGRRRSKVWIICVEDSGPGIPKDKRHVMFERCQDSLSVMVQGTGVGLNLCKRLVGLMGGRIYYDESYRSEIEGCPGARVVVELPQTPISVSSSTSSSLLGQDLPLKKMMSLAESQQPQALPLFASSTPTKQLATPVEGNPSCAVEPQDQGNPLCAVTPLQDQGNPSCEVTPLQDQGNPSCAVTPLQDQENLPCAITPLQDQGNPPCAVVIPQQDRENPAACAVKPQQQQQQDQEQNLSSASAAAAIPQNLSILFVDDDRVLRKLATRSIKKALPDCQVHEATSGESAIQLVVAAAEQQQKEFDIIFMDQYMTSCIDQALKGTETVRILRAQGCKSVICGLSANGLEESFVGAGADAFFLKPFPCKSKEVLDTITHLRALRDGK